VKPLAVTPRQLEVLRTLRRLSLREGRMPSVRELALALGRSPSTIHQHLRALERRGFVARSGTSHGLDLLVDDKALWPSGRPSGRLLPIRAELEPGRPLHRLPSPPARIAVEGATGPRDWVLNILGDGAADGGILAGDALIIRPGDAGEAPALVELSDGTSDLRAVRPMGRGWFSLLPARLNPNPNHAVRARGVRVRGRIVRLLRAFPG
jgi:repressor LexA